jgi:predicted RNase H-like HicB family nuclease
MLYPVAVEAGDATHAFGVVVPDLPGCFSAGDTFEEALANAREAIELHVEGLLDAGEKVPAPSPVDKLVGDPDLKGFVWAFIDVPAEAFDNAVERVNVTIPRRVLHAIDQAAKRQRKTRSAYLAEAALFFDRMPQDSVVLHSQRTRRAPPAAKRARKAMKKAHA